MKKILLLLVVAVLGLAMSNADANPADVLRRTRIKTQEIASRSNLLAIYNATMEYRAQKKSLPTSGAAGLSELNITMRALLNPYHALGAQQETPSKLTEAKAGYAYFGSVAGSTAGFRSGASTPLAFEKPQMRGDGKVQILFLNGDVKTMDTKADNCAGVIAELRKSNPKADDTLWNALAETAKTIDEAK